MKNQTLINSNNLDKQNLRNAGIASGALIFMFMLIPDLTVSLAKLIYDRTGFYFFSPLLKLHSNMDMFIGSLLQLLGASISAYIVSLFYKFGALDLFKKNGLSTKDNAFIDKDDTFYKNWRLVVVLAIPFVYLINISTSVIIDLFTKFIERDGFVVPQADISFNNLKPSTLLIFFFSLCVFAPLIEEYLMRGCMIKILKPFGNWFAIIVSSLMFGLLHNNIGQGFGATIIGIVFGFIAVKSQSIWPCIILHAINNFIYFLSLILVVKENEFLTYIWSSVMLIALILGVFVLFKYACKQNLSDNNTTSLSRGECYRRYFTNIVVLIYLAYNLFNFIYPFFIENNATWQ